MDSRFEQNGRFRIFFNSSEDEEQGDTPPPKGNTPSKLQRMRRWILPAALLTGLGVLAAEYDLGERGPVRRTVAGIRAQYVDLFKDPTVERQQWRYRLAERALQIICDSPVYSPEEKAEFTRRFHAANGDDEAFLVLLEDMSMGASSFYGAERSKRLPAYFVDSDVHHREWHAASDAVLREYPHVRALITLHATAEYFDRVGSDGPFRMRLSEVIQRCEKSMKDF